jgi:AI-2 transport protein TqsA
MSNKNYDSRIQTVCMVLLTLVAVAITLKLMKAVIVPFILAVFLVLVMIPVVEFLIRKLRIRRGIALVLTLFIGGGLMLGLGVLIVYSVTQFASNAHEYEVQFAKLVEKMEAVLPLDDIMEFVVGEDVSDTMVSTTLAPETSIAVSEGDSTSASESTKTPLSMSGLIPKGSIKGLVYMLTGEILGIVSKFFLVMLFTAFLLTGSTTQTKPREGLVGEIESRVQKYIGIKIVLSLLTGGLIFLILQLLGVEFALSFGVFAFVLNFIPNVGSVIATILPLPIVLLSPESTWVTLALAVLLPLTVQIVIGNVMEPKIMGNTLGLHPIVILMALIFWGMLWGFPGMLLAAPMTSITKIILHRIEVTRPFAALMEGDLNAINQMSPDDPPAAT